MLLQGSHVRILHLEDSPIDAELTEANLTGGDFTCEIVVVSNAEDFIKAITSDIAFDAIISDYSIPGFDGMSALTLARIHLPSTPFIFLSGALGEDLAVETLRSGATDYVLKHKMDRLLPVLRRAINEHRAQEKQRQFQIEVSRAKEEAEKANAAKSHFLSRISHELRTPLNAILGYTQLMQADPLSEDQAHCTNQIIKAGGHLLNLINEVLDISRIEAGQLKLIIKDTSIRYVIRQAIDMVEPLSLKEGIEIHFDENSCDQTVLADEDRINQVLINLLTNAIKYNQPGGKVFVSCEAGQEGFVKTVVRDTGRGIAPEKLSRLFTPFDRLDAEHETKIPGTGLGLSVAKGLIEAMRGTLEASSVPGKSSTFWFELPLSPNQNGAAAPQTAAPENHLEPDKSGEAVHVLLVEDNPVNADFMERVFRRYPRFQLTLAENGRTAVDVSNQQDFDIILMDLHLPDFSGLEALNRIRENHPYLPVVFISADVSPETIEALTNSSANAFLNKPVNINEMFDIINSVTAKK